MVFVKYDFPLPNDGDNYKFTKEELVNLLDKVYDRGFQYGKEIATPAEVSVAATYENIDDKTRWKEEWTK